MTPKTPTTPKPDAQVGFTEKCEKKARSVQNSWLFEAGPGSFSATQRITPEMVKVGLLFKNPWGDGEQWTRVVEVQGQRVMLETLDPQGDVRQVSLSVKGLTTVYGQCFTPQHPTRANPLLREPEGR